ALHSLSVPPDIPKKTYIKIIAIPAVGRHPEHAGHIESLEPATICHIHSTCIIQIAIVNPGRMVAMTIPAILSLGCITILHPARALRQAAAWNGKKIIDIGGHAALCSVHR